MVSSIKKKLNPQNMPLYLEIVTPDSITFSKEVESVVIPTANGRIDILPKHIPIIDKVVPGYLKIEHEGSLITYPLILALWKYMVIKYLF